MSATSHLLRRVALAALAFVLLAPGAKPAAAQDFFSFLWSGGSRDVVPFSRRYSPRQIIVSFGDRKLYWIRRRGEAISYPIAVPRAQSRWSGVTSVSSKRVVQSAGQARSLSGLLDVPHSRHGRSLDHRHGRLQGLHPHVQRGCARSISACAGRHKGHRHLEALPVTTTDRTSFLKTPPDARRRFLYLPY